MSDVALSKPQEKAVERSERRPVVAPPVDIFENAEKMLLVADFPGVAQEDVAIHFEKGTLTLEGRRNLASPGRVLASETQAFDYKRSFGLPQGIDADKISAELQNGVLFVHLPKSEALRPRRIEVKAS